MRSLASPRGEEALSLTKKAVAAYEAVEVSMKSAARSLSSCARQRASLSGVIGIGFSVESVLPGFKMMSMLST